MNFEFSEDQQLLRDQTRRFLEGQSDSEAVRRVLEGDEPYHPELWRQIGEMGYPGAAVPESLGGIEAGHLELCVIAEELGRALAPVPFASSVYLVAEALLLAGSDGQKERLLPRLAGGETVGAAALAEQPGSLTPSSIETIAEDGRLTGRKIPVLDGTGADIALVPARNAGGEGAEAITLFLVDLHGDGVTRRTVRTVDPTRKQAEIRLERASAEPLGAEGEGWQLLTRLLDRAAVLVAFEQLGGAQRTLEMARDYALERYAFGRPIGSFQAIKHRLADMFAAVELARSNCYFGAWALANDADELPVAAATARISAGEAFHVGARENIQIHGGMGFTWESDCHLFYRRAKLLDLMLDAPPDWKDALIRRLDERGVA